MLKENNITLLGRKLNRFGENLNRDKYISFKNTAVIDLKLNFQKSLRKNQLLLHQQSQ